MRLCFRSGEEVEVGEKTQSVRNAGHVNMLCALKYPVPTETLRHLRFVTILQSLICKTMYDLPFCGSRSILGRHRIISFLYSDKRP